MKKPPLYKYIIPLLILIVSMFFLFEALQAIAIILLCYFMTQSIILVLIDSVFEKIEKEGL